jgi:uncharacterized damage-inducible protein DinB
MKNLLLNQFDLNQRLYGNVLKGFTNEETEQRLNDDTNINHVKYIAGHLLNAQYILADIAGADYEAKWNDLFAGLRQTKARDDITYPDIETIKDEWNKLYELTRPGLESLTEADLQKEASNESFEIVGEMWAFFNHHQAYHIGQIGILRRGFGKEPMSYE